MSNKNPSALNKDRIDSLLQELGEGWKIVEKHKLKKEFEFKDFKTALDFTNKVGEAAEEQDHHPDIFLSYGKVKIELWTHKVNGLTEKDFRLASKCDELFTG